MTRPPVAHLAALWAAVVVPSSPIVHRQGGVWALLGYALVVALLIAAAPRAVAALRREHANALAVLTGVAIVVVFAAVYPRVNVQQPWSGSDDDDAHNVGVAALLDGESPYGRHTYLDNALHQLPGAFVLAAPFVLAGTAALQNLICLPLFYLLLRTRAADDRSALGLWWLITVVSVAVGHGVVTGSSYPWSAIWIVLAMHVVLTRHPRNAYALVFLAVVICSRPNFLMLIVPLAGFVWRRHGAVAAGRMVAIVGAVLALTVIVTIAATMRVRDVDGVYRASALILATPVLAGLLIGAAISAEVTWSFEPYALFVPWFLAFGNIRAIEPWLGGAISSPVLLR